MLSAAYLKIYSPSTGKSSSHSNVCSIPPKSLPGTFDGGTKVVDVIDDDEWQNAVAQRVTYVDVEQITEQQWVDAGRGEDGTPDRGAIVTETIVEVDGGRESRLVVANEYGNETANTPVQIEQQQLTVFTTYDDMISAVGTSREEGGPLSIPETLACGVPLNTSKVGMAEEFIKDQINGFLVDIGDIEKYIVAYNLLRNLSAMELNNLKENAKLMSKELDWLQISKKYLKEIN